MSAAGLLADPAEVRRLLISSAAAGESITYSELLNALGLAAVDDEAAERGEPELAVLVVRQSDGLPGQGWWVGGAAMLHGYDGLWTGPDAARLVRKLQRRAFAFWSAQLTG